MVLENLGVHGLKKDSNGFRCSCPIHGSKNSTGFVLNPYSHLYNCYGECNIEHKDGDIIKLVSLVQKCAYDESVKLICEWTNIDIKIIENSDDWLLEELRNNIDNLLNSIIDNKQNIIDNEWEYGVQPLSEELAAHLIGQKDDEGFIDSLGFNATTLTLFESGFEPRENRWLLPIRSADGILLGFDGRDTTNQKKDKWKKRKGLLTSKLLGRLDISKPYILEKDEIILCEGKKDQMALYEAGLKNGSCLYGSALSNHQLEIIQGLCSKITIFPDGDKAGYKMVQSIVKSAYPEFEILVAETPDYEDPADLTTSYVRELYTSSLNVEEWLERYKYRISAKK